MSSIKSTSSNSAGFPLEALNAPQMVGAAKYCPVQLAEANNATHLIQQVVVDRNIQDYLKKNHNIPLGKKDTPEGAARQFNNNVVHNLGMPGGKDPKAPAQKR